MEEVVWVGLPFIAALGAGVLSYIITQARMEAALARDREELIEVRERLTQQQRTFEERLRAVEAEARRKALDEFLADVRVEERHYLREVDHPSGRRRCMVLQERVCFRHIPLTQWIERELLVEGEAHPIAMPQQAPAPKPAPVEGRRRLLR